MPTPRNRQFRALMAILTAIYALLIVAAVAALLKGQEPARPTAVIASIVFIAAGLALLIRLYQNREWARRVLLALSLIWVAWALKTALRSLLADYLMAKASIVPLDLYVASLFWLVFLALPVAIIYLAMAYPEGSPAPPAGPDPLTRAR